MDCTMGLSFCLVFCSCIISSLQDCSLQTDVGTKFKECSIDGNSILVDEGGSVPETAICQIEKDGLNDTMVCDNRKWSQTDILLVKQHRNRRSLGDVLFCFVTFFSCLWGRSRDSTPPTVFCPPSATYDADPIQTNKRYVTWDTATATDDKDGSRPVTLHGKRKRSTFGEGVTPVTYVAKDKSGNRGSCTFTITVKVYRCSSPRQVENGYYICHPSVDFVQGTRCRFGCYDGFDLKPSHATSMTCQTSRDWSLAQPTCKPFECPPLPVIEGADLTCSNGRYFRSICVYKCITGYDMPPSVSASLVCAINKQWRKHGEPRCVDVERPLFISCPSIVIAGTETGVPTATVGWIDPVVADNSNTTIVPRQIKGEPPGTKLSAGTHNIEYSAVDEGGNRARSCSFKVVVRDILCPRLYPTPYTQFTCPDGYRSGVLCNISCDSGKVMDGPDFVLCEKSNKGLYGQWKWNGNQTLCKNAHSCSAIQPPLNGAVACDNWIGGQFCQVQCRKGTDMTNVNWKHLYACGKSGEWIPTPIVLPCKQTEKKPRTSLQIHAAYYYQGECSDEATRAEIQSNFVNALNASRYSAPTCQSRKTECIAQNVHVSCGKSKFTEREKRDTNNTTESLLKVTMEIVLLSDENNSMGSEIRDYAEIYRTLKSDLGDMTIVVNGDTIDVLLKTIENDGLSMTCGEGSVVSTDSFMCVDCPEGTYFDGTTVTCQNCRKGTFQSSQGKLSCTECDIRKTTRRNGSSSEADCEDACMPGMWSGDGAYPCSVCEISTYSSEYGSQFCTWCPGSTSTLAAGSSDISDCKEFDVVFLSGNISEGIVVLEDTFVTDDVYISYWVQMNLTNGSEFQMNLQDENNADLMSMQHSLQEFQFNYNGYQDSFMMDITDNMWHFVQIEVENCSLTLRVDDTEIASGNISDECKPFEFKSLSFAADDNISGRWTQFNMWSALQYMNTGSTPSCFKSETADMFSWKSVSESELDEAYIELNSLCDDFDNCLSNPCVQGTCYDAIDTFSCECFDGFSGTRCDTNIDDCVLNMCMNGGSCVDGVSKYTCSCPHNYTGIYCEIEMVHGSWGTWGNWSECSTSCDDGVKYRQRVCNDPAPDNGGLNCQGNASDQAVCNLEECLSCPELNAPVNGTIDCDMDGETYNCTISCDEGFEFDTPPMDHYYCGPDTFHEWNFETTENPLRRLPKCAKIHLPKKLAIQYTARYTDLTCSADTNGLIHTQVDAVVNTIECVQDGHCDASYTTNCDIVTRRKRSLGTAGFTVTFNTQLVNVTDDSNAYGLKDAFEHVYQSAQDGDMTVRTEGGIYLIDLNSTSVNGIVECGPGYVQASIYCVLCGLGSYVDTDRCERCEFGTYQDQEGQASCKQCPEGKSTIGMGSVSELDCTVEVATDVTSYLVIGLAVGCSIGFVILVVVVGAIIYRQRGKKTKKAEIHQHDNDINIYDISTDNHPDLKSEMKPNVSVTCLNSLSQQQ